MDVIIKDENGARKIILQHSVLSPNSMKMLLEMTDTIPFFKNHLKASLMRTGEVLEYIFEQLTDIIISFRKVETNLVKTASKTNIIITCDTTLTDAEILHHPKLIPILDKYYSTFWYDFQSALMLEGA